MIYPYSKHKHSIAFMILAGAIEIVVVVFYAIFGNIVMNDSNLWADMAASAKFYYFFLMNLNNIFFGLVLLAGFGLVMVYIKHTSWNALGFSLLITCICIQLYPLVSTFWNNVFVYGFRGENVIIDPSYSMNGSLRVAICMLVVLATLIGRIGPLDTLIVGVSGTILYSLNIALNTSIAKSRSSDANINDVGGAMDIFLFGGILGVVIGRFLRNMNTLIHQRFTSGPGNEHPILALVGTMFIWSGFSYLSINNPDTQKFMDLGVMNSYFSLASCVLTICALSAIIHLRIGIFQIVFGTIAGGVAIGSCSMIIVNPAISILLGIVAGSLTYLYLHFLHKWVNKEGVVDATGVVGVYIVNGILSPIFSAILIACYSTYPTWKPLFLGVTVGVDGGASNATFQLIHLGVTVGIAILSGIALGWILKILGSKEEIFELFNDTIDFGTNYQLTSMPTIILPPPIYNSRVAAPPQQMHIQTSSARLFGNNITSNVNNNPVIPPAPLSPIKYLHQNLSRPASPTPVITSQVVAPGRPLTPIRNLSPIQARSIIYNQQPVSPRPYNNLQQNIPAPPPRPPFQGITSIPPAPVHAPTLPLNNIHKPPVPQINTTFQMPVHVPPHLSSNISRRT